MQGSGSGRVVMTKGSRDGVRMTVETRGLPKIGAGQFFEVWLFNPKTQKMLALGVLGPGGKASFDVADSLMGRYQVVDVSLERDDGDPDHSVTSVLRAKVHVSRPSIARQTGSGTPGSLKRTVSRCSPAAAISLGQAAGWVGPAENVGRKRTTD
jgi:hypothetical protein